MSDDRVDGPTVAEGVVLALDTATSVVNVAVGRDGDVLAQESVLTERRHAELITALVARVMDDSGVSWNDLAAVVACVGPGLFTGLRVGIATARSIAHVCGIPTVGVSSLEALARSVDAPQVIATLDARRGEVAWAVFEAGERRSPDRIDPPEAVFDAVGCPVDDLDTTSHGGFVLAGSGVGRLVEAGVVTGQDLRPDAVPTPGAILELGVRSLARDEVLDVNHLVPNYLRRTDAEIAHDRSAT